MSIRESEHRVLLEAMIGGSEGLIERQEARGQSKLVNSDVLPTEMNCREGKAMEILESWGVKIHDIVEGDDLFVNVTLPEGWKKVASDHSMHSDLVDDKGRIRANIFYKAAFYDRRADMNLSSRYSVKQIYDYDKKPTCHQFHVVDGDNVLFESSQYPFDARYHDQEDNYAARKPYIDEYFKAREDAEKDITQWISEHYPDWRNPAAYWED